MLPSSLNVNMIAVCTFVAYLLLNLNAWTLRDARGQSQTVNSQLEEVEMDPVTISAWIPKEIETFVYTHVSTKKPSFFERRMLEKNTSFLSFIFSDDSDIEAIQKEVVFSMEAAREFKPITKIPGSSSFEGLTIIGFSKEVEDKVGALLDDDEFDTFVFKDVMVRKRKLDASTDGAKFSFLAFPESSIAVVTNCEDLLKECLRRRQLQTQKQQAALKPWLVAAASSMIARRTLRSETANEPEVVLNIRFDPVANACIFECSGNLQVIRDWRNHVNKCFTYAKLPEFEISNKTMGFKLELSEPNEKEAQIYPKRDNEVLALVLTSLGYLNAP